ncbi:MAG TPA: Mur ligase family protein [Gemmatimonadales bacterium]|nr:Mur ligase family protein [Gemmatimonadales bacterium]
MTDVLVPNRTDSRRLTGPNRLMDRAGAVIDVELPGSPAAADPIVAAWRAQARRILDALGWGHEELHVLRFPGGASLGFTAPADVLYAATEVNESAWDAALAVASGSVEPPLGPTVATLSARIEQERNPRLLALADAARRHGVQLLADQQVVSAGEGSGSIAWPVTRLPDPDAVSWAGVHDVPVALVTGSNGKTTTVRLLAAMLARAGRPTGFTCTDGVFVGGEALARGDYAGPEGARMLLRDRRVEAAVLETARGGLLRRGLAVERAEVAVVTNIAADHFGEFGVYDLSALAEAKLVVARALGARGKLVLNAEDAALVSAAVRLAAPIVWFALDSGNAVITRHIAAAGDACVVEEGAFVLRCAGRRELVAPVAAAPITFGGSARHNVANALAAIAAAAALAVPLEAMAGALLGFQGSAIDNPGRANLYEVGGVRVVVDFAHNPQGMAALADIAAALPARRRLVAVGQAGDRDDSAIRDLVRAAHALRPDHVIVKEMEKYRRGRAPGEVPGLLTDEFRRLGVPNAAISTAPDDLGALRRALEWAHPGDLLLVTIHVDQQAALGLLDRLRRARWEPGQPIPR